MRWVHVAEVPDIATLLRGGELVLTTGIGLPADDAGLRAFITDLADVGVAGLVVELGRRYVGTVPRVMVAAAERRGLPLVELRRATPFVRITEAVHALIVDAQLTELRATEEIHQRFTELSVEGAEPAEVLPAGGRAGRLPGGAGEPVPAGARRTTPPGSSAELLLDGWEQHSRRIRPAGRTAYDPDTGWLVTTVGARGQDWGRLLLRWPPGDGSARPGSAADPADDPARAGRVHAGAGPADPPRRRGAGAADPPHPAHRAARPHPAGGRGGAAGARRSACRWSAGTWSAWWSGTAATTAGGRRRRRRQARLRDLAEAVGQALREAKLDRADQRARRPGRGRAAGAARAGDEERALAAFADRRCAGYAAAARRCVIVAAGSGVGSLREARRSLVEARQVAEAARHDRRDVPVLPAAARRAGRAAAPAARRAAAADLRRAGAGRRCWRTTPSTRGSSCSARCGRTWTRAATSRRRPRRRTCPGRRSTSGWPGSPASSAPTWTRSPCLSLHVALLALDAIRDA